MSKGQSSGGGSECEYSVCVKNLPYFSTAESLISHFSTFGEVDEVNFIHKVADYIRCAEVKMKSTDDVQKILSSPDPHTIDGKVVQVMPYQGMDTHVKEFVKGDFHLYFNDLFDPGLFVKANLNDNEAKAEKAWMELDDAFQPFEYTKISLTHDQVKCWFYNGCAKVSFKDGEQRNEIMETAKGRFSQCHIRHAMYYC
ncbi:hypothetical protein QVD17_11083 [Tagetes erecta]|uniref:RRM domain-containing protein n=1 Tax=Tagetes erecta TaxID=13708 RepID=A0AAD8L2E5_TARER|nr:hypothetical protein QVD17_11083 [Tagetes erecta]